MLKNADCTFFEGKTRRAITAKGVYWFDSRGAAVSKGGIQISDSVLVYLYDTQYVPKAGDIIVKGVSDFTFDATSQQSESESMRRFREVYPDFAVVKSMHDCRYGSLPHIEVIAR